MKRILFLGVIFGVLWLAWPRGEFARPIVDPIARHEEPAPVRPPQLVAQATERALDAVAPRRPAQAQSVPAKSEGRTQTYDGDTEAQLEALDRLRKIPGAAPMVDEIVKYLASSAGDEDMSLDNIPTGEAGLAVVDDHALEYMVHDKHIRETWEKLMALVAQHPEAVADPGEQESDSTRSD